MRVTFLGTGGSEGNVRRANTSLAITVGDSTVLIDCSGSPAQALGRAGLPWARLPCVFVTHRHADHVYGIPSLLHQIFLATYREGRSPLTICGPEEALSVARALAQSVGLLARPGMFEVVWRAVGPGELIEVGGVRLKTFEAKHGAVQTLGVRAWSSEKSEAAVVYSADTEPSESLIREAMQAALLLHDCSSFDAPMVPSHTVLAQIPGLLEAARPAKLGLVHLPMCSADEEADARRFLDESCGARAFLAEDGMEVEL